MFVEVCEPVHECRGQKRAGLNLSLSAYFLETRYLPDLETHILLVWPEANGEPPVSTSVGAGVGIHGHGILIGHGVRHGAGVTAGDLPGVRRGDRRTHGVRPHPPAHRVLTIM